MAGNDCILRVFIKHQSISNFLVPEQVTSISPDLQPNSKVIEIRPMHALILRLQLQAMD